VRQRGILALAAASLAALAFGILVLGIVSVSHANLSALAFGVTMLLFIVGILLGFAAWIAGLMRTARYRRWDWFVAVLFLGPLGALLYSLAGSAGSLALNEPAM
jgi:hypothetical protein